MSNYLFILIWTSIILTVPQLASAQSTRSASYGLEINGVNILEVIQRQQEEIERLRGNFMQLAGIRDSVLQISDKLNNFITRYESDSKNGSQSSTIPAAISDQVSNLKCDLYKIFYSEAWCDRSLGVTVSNVYGFADVNMAGIRLTSALYCDMNTDGGQWAVIQRRVSGSLNFTTNWNAYEDGFGDAANEYWLGLEKVHNAIAAVPHELRVDFFEENATTQGKSVYAKYSSVDIKAKCSNYQLILGTYSGNAGDILGRFNGSFFSTYDKDNDQVSGRNCAQALQGGWWYSNPCTSQAGNLNSPLSEMSNWGVQFDPVDGTFQIKTVEIKIRPS